MNNLAKRVLPAVPVRRACDGVSDRARPVSGYVIHPLWNLFTALLLSTIGVAVNAQEYITGVRLSGPSELVVGQARPVTVQFLDAAGNVVAPEPNRLIQIAPAGLYPCLVERCADADYAEQFNTAPGQAEYRVFVRSLAAGRNFLTVRHPNGAYARAEFNAVDSAPPPAPEPPPVASGQAVGFGLAAPAPALEPGACAAVEVRFLDASGQSVPSGVDRLVRLAPGGGAHPSTDRCASYRNADVFVAAADAGFTLYTYVLPGYSGHGATRLSAAGLPDLLIEFDGNVEPSGGGGGSGGLLPQVGDVGVWANDGGEKITREEVRSFDGDVTNSVWDGVRIRTFGARNEVVSFNVVVDNRGADLAALAVDFSRLAGNGYALETTDHTTGSLFDWRNRPIEVFAVRYLKVHGLSRIAYERYDETHTPEKLRRPYLNLHPQGPAIGSGTWWDRPHHDRSYPDIAVPQEAIGSVALRSGQSQSFWVDVYLPKEAPAGVLQGELSVRNGSSVIATVPVEIEVLNATLADDTQARNMVYIGDDLIAERYFAGANGVLNTADYGNYRRVIDNHFKLAWRHRISLIDRNELVAHEIFDIDRPNADWVRRLQGGLYTADQGYAGPGQGRPHDVFSIGTYSSWTRWWGVAGFDPENPSYDPSLPESLLRLVLTQRSNEWESWFRANAPQVERFLYVDDEPKISSSASSSFFPIDFAEQVSRLIKENPGVGGALKTFVTSSPLGYDSELPSTSILADVIAHGQTEPWENATQALRNDPDRGFFMYNGRRPASGSFVIEDDGVALRQLPWGQFKLNIHRWYYWHGTYYNNFQGGPALRFLPDVDPDGSQYRLGTQTNVFRSAHTFGGHTHFDPVFGETGWNYSNGDGVLLYPGTDRIFPADSLQLDGPLASLRLKHWRRGIQDVEYIRLAMAKDPVATVALIESMVPEVMWELGVFDEADPTFVHKAPSWSNDPDVWEQARKRLANILLGYAHFPGL